MLVVSRVWCVIGRCVDSTWEGGTQFGRCALERLGTPFVVVCERRSKGVTL